MNDTDFQKFNRDWSNPADKKDDLFPICWHDFDWRKTESHPPEDTPILVRFTEGEHRGQAVVTFYKTGMFGPKFDFRHCANYVEETDKIQVCYWSELPTW